MMSGKMSVHVAGLIAAAAMNLAASTAFAESKYGPGGQRILGVPTVADRVAQMVVKQLIEPDLDPIFLGNSYG